MSPKKMWRGRGGPSNTLVGSGTVQAGDFFVAPNVVYGNGDGSLGNPWNIRTAFQFGGTQLRGHTVWMRGGTYTPVGDGSGLDSYWVAFDGLVGSRITCRSYPGEWARIDGGTTGIGTPILRLQGNYYTLQEFEIFSSETLNGRETTTPGSAPADILYGTAVAVEQDGSNYTGIKFVNLVVHDAAQGFSWWQQAVDSEMYGCIIYHNGWTTIGVNKDRPHGHGVYADNWTSPGGTKTAKENVSFRNFADCFDLYNESAETQVNWDIQGNVFFKGGGLDPGFSSMYSFLVGGDADPVGDSSSTIHDNYIYAPGDGSAFRIGFAGHVYDAPNIHDNFMPQVDVNAAMSGSTANITGNVLTHTEGDDFDIGVQNTFRAKPLTGSDVFVRANAYETGRAHIIVYNWDQSSTVNADISGVFTNGWNYVVYNVQNILGSPVASGTYGGGSITLPMTTGGGLVQAPPYGYAAPSATWPEFNVFLLRKV